LLLKHGGKDLLLLKDNDGAGCLHAAAQDGHSDVVGILEEACKEYGLSRSEASTRSFFSFQDMVGEFIKCGWRRS
jgi:hypothetical protein